jgi:hypothetical protein
MIIVIMGINTSCFERRERFDLCERGSLGPVNFGCREIPAGVRKTMFISL